MSSRRPGPNSRLQQWINAANRVGSGWRAEVKVKRVIFTTPQGQEIPVAQMAQGTDLQRFEQRVRNLGLALPDAPPREVPQEEPSERPSEIDGLSVEQQAMRVWGHAREHAIAHTTEEQMHDGVLYYVWRKDGLEAFIRRVFPSLTEYEPVRGSWGQRPIYDFLRARGVAFEQGQRADHKPGEHTVMIADVWNVEVVREVSRSAAREARRAAREEVEREVPQVIRGVGEKATVSRETLPEPQPETAEVSDLRAAWDMFLPTMQQALDRLTSEGDCDYYKADAANQRTRAEAAEGRLADIREALETLPMAQAFARIVEIVPPVHR